VIVFGIVSNVDVPKLKQEKYYTYRVILNNVIHQVPTSMKQTK
jgi:hypothetical protein